MQQRASIMRIMATVAVIILGSGVVCGFAWFTGNRLTSVVDAGATELETTYSNVGFGFKARVPTEFGINESYTYYALGPGQEIPGIAFKIPSSLYLGTNLSADSYISVERIGRASCRPSDFLDTPTTAKAQVRELGSNHYLYGITSGAGAGNLYEEHIYVTKHNGMCYGVRFFIHMTQIANYPAGTVTEFDKDALIARFRHLTSTIKFI